MNLRKLPILVLPDSKMSIIHPQMTIHSLYIMYATRYHAHPA